jgi:hypothetical protein
MTVMMSPPAEPPTSTMSVESLHGADDLDQTVRAIRRQGAAASETRIVLRAATSSHPIS